MVGLLQTISKVIPGLQQEQLVPNFPPSGLDWAAIVKYLAMIHMSARKSEF